MMNLKFAALAVGLIAPPAQAETVYSLDAAEIEKVVPAPVVERTMPVAAEAPAPRDRRVRGEVTMGIGTGGYRGIGGPALVPLSDDAWAAVSFETGQYGRRVHRRR